MNKLKSHWHFVKFTEEFVALTMLCEAADPPCESQVCLEAAALV